MAIVSGELVARLETPLPTSLEAGAAPTLFCFGTCFHRRGEGAAVAIVVDGVRHRPTAMRMPRPDVFGADPRGYRSGFWGSVQIAPGDTGGAIDLALAARLASGAEEVVSLGRIEIAAADPPAPLGR